MLSRTEGQNQWHKEYMDLSLVMNPAGGGAVPLALIFGIGS